MKSLLLSVVGVVLGLIMETWGRYRGLAFADGARVFGPSPDVRPPASHEQRRTR